MENKKIYQTETKTIIDHQTGEIIQTEHNQKGFVEKEPDYVKLYLQDIATFKLSRQLSSQNEEIFPFTLNSLIFNIIHIL
jgi:non-homologous end joining protein Ku